MGSYNYNYFIEIIEEIRKNKKINLEDLVDNIISSRTYWRYYKYEKEAKLNVVNALINRLNVSLSDIVFFKLHTKQKIHYLNEFLLLYSREKLHECKPLYESLLNYDNESEDYLILIHCFLRKYEMDMGIISSEQYINFLEESYKKVMLLNTDSMYTNYFYSLYLLTFKTIDDFIYSKLIHFYLDESQVSKRILLYFYFIPDVINYLLDINYDIKVIEKVSVNFKQSITMRPDVYKINDYYKFQLRIDYLNNNIESFNSNMFRYIMGIRVLKNKSEYQERIKEIQSLYNINVLELIHSETLKAFDEYRQ